jgi:[acyl-carrier-protein] S-malonyltransferase
MKIAFVFPGQGSQSVGMGADLYAKYPSAARVMDEIDERIGYKLTSICFYGPEETLRSTSITQPALFAVSVAALEVLNERGIVPHAVAGHSVGEYAALAAAGAIDRRDGVSLVNRRGEIMQQAAETTPGAMAAVIGLDAETVWAICAETEASGYGIVDAANINGAGQIVISGEAAAVAQAGELAVRRGAKRVIPLAVSGGFHSRLMASAAAKMKSVIDGAAVTDAKVPVVANATAEYETGASQIKANLAAQIDHSVLWEQSVALLLADGFDTFVEVGSGLVLSGLIKRMSKEATLYNTSDSGAIESTITALNELAS